MFPGFAHLLLAFVGATATFSAVKTAQPPPFTAVFKDSVWHDALTATAFENFTVLRPARYATTARLLYDARNLYVAFRCEQRGAPIVATQSVDNASVTSDDHVTLWLDPSGNGARTYSFSASPRGVRSETSSENARYAPPWRAIARITPSGYDVLMIVPLRDLRAAGGASQRWRINFERYVASANEDDTWAFQPAQTSIASPQFWPTLDRIQIASATTHPRPYADIYALASAGADHDQFQNGIGSFQTTKPRTLGLDATVPLTNTLAFVGTLAPDFSNVEEDQTTIAPQEFARVYNEYRPFFAQGAQYIDTLPQPSLFGGGNQMLYTPSIGIFDRGLKLEGTAGRNAIGLLNVEGPGFDDSAFGYTYALPNNAFSASTQGVLARHADITDDTYGFALAQTNPHSGQFTQVQEESESGTLVNAPGLAQSTTLTEGIRTQHLYAEALYDDIGPEYAPLDGYTAIDDERGGGIVGEYLGVGAPASILQSYTVTLFGDRYFDRGGSVRQADVNGFATVNFKDLISVSGFAGPSELRSYESGYPFYTGGVTDWYNRRQIEIAYRNNTATPTVLSYAWGPFAGGYVQQTAASLTRAFGPYGVTLEYDGNVERAAPGAPILTSQWLRRVALSRAFGRDATLALSYRAINGAGGFAIPGSDLALLYQQRFANQDELYLEYGTPAAVVTLHRFIAKYVFHVGGGTGS